MKKIIALLSLSFFLFLAKGNAQATYKVTFKEPCLIKLFIVSYAITNDDKTVAVNYEKMVGNEINVPQGKYITLKTEPLLQNTSNTLKGISVLDILMMSDHILGFQPLPLKYQLAADVNGSGTISTADMVELKKALFGLTTQMPFSNLWRIYSTNKTINTLHFIVEKDMILDYQVYKIGDVSGNATCN
jgi:hypothetical protein